MNNIPRVVIALLVISGVLTIALGEPLYRSGRWGLNGDETMIWLVSQYELLKWCTKDSPLYLHCISERYVD